MTTSDTAPTAGADAAEARAWFEAHGRLLELALRGQEPARVRRLMSELLGRLRQAGLAVPQTTSTPYVNTIPPERQPVMPGNRELERRIKSLIRWNAMAMVVRANSHTNVGGHISTYASCATLYEVGFNHFFRGAGRDHPADIVYFQGHASPGVYARAFLEGRLDERHLELLSSE